MQDDDTEEEDFVMMLDADESVTEPAPHHPDDAVAMVMAPDVVAPVAEPVEEEAAPKKKQEVTEGGLKSMMLLAAFPALFSLGTKEKEKTKKTMANDGKKRTKKKRPQTKAKIRKRQRDSQKTTVQHPADAIPITMTSDLLEMPEEEIATPAVKTETIVEPQEETDHWLNQFKVSVSLLHEQVNALDDTDLKMVDRRNEAYNEVYAASNKNKELTNSVFSNIDDNFPCSIVSVKKMKKLRKKITALGEMSPTDQQKNEFLREMDSILLGVREAEAEYRMIVRELEELDANQAVVCREAEMDLKADKLVKEVYFLSIYPPKDALVMEATILYNEKRGGWHAKYPFNLVMPWNKNEQKKIEKMAEDSFDRAQERFKNRIVKEKVLN